MALEPVEGLNLIDGHWLRGEAAAWERLSPGDGSLLGRGHWASPAQGLAAVAAARRAFGEWSERPLDERMAICRNFAMLVTESKHELACLIATETGKPLWEAETEVAATIAKVENSIDSLMTRRWTTTQAIGDYLAVTRYRPHGVLFVIGPFNFPAHIPGGHIVPALLAGNTLVFKPSEFVSVTGQWLCRMWMAAGLPPGVLNLVHGAAEVASAIVEDEHIDGVLFTGSYRVGASLHRALAGKPEKVLALEMGGNNSLIVHEASDIRGAAILAILSAFITSGQRCTCARRLIVSGAEAYAQMIEVLADLIPKIRIGLPMDAAQPFMGPLIHSQAAQQILNAQSRLCAQGATALVPVKSDERSAALLSPGALLIDARQEAEDCELFGPLLMIYQASDLDQAIALANDTRFGLAAGFIGDQILDFHYVLHRVRAGIVNWNRQTTGASGKLPFGGVGLSGNHHPSGYFAADYCSYPIASLESHALSEAHKPLPGLDFIE